MVMPWRCGLLDCRALVQDALALLQEELAREAQDAASLDVDHENLL